MTDSSASYDYLRAKDQERRHAAAVSAIFWAVLTILFVSWGGYYMYVSMGIIGILKGMLLFVAAVVTSFLMICSASDVFS